MKTKLTAFIIAVILMLVSLSSCAFDSNEFDNIPDETESETEEQATTSTETTITTTEKPKGLTSEEAKAILVKYIEENGSPKGFQYTYHDDNNEPINSGVSMQKAVTYEATENLGQNMKHDLKLTVGYTDENILIYYFQHIRYNTTDTTYSFAIVSADGENYTLHLNSRWHKASTRTIGKNTNFRALSYKVFAHSGCSGYSSDCSDYASHAIVECMKSFDSFLQTIDPQLNVKLLGFRY